MSGECLVGIADHMTFDDDHEQLIACLACVCSGLDDS